MTRPSKRALERAKVLTEAEQQAPAIEIRHLTLTFPERPGAAEASAAEAKPELGEAAHASATRAPPPTQPTSASMEPSYVDIDLDSGAGRA